MSNYNAQLQSNNTDLQTVLQTLQNKAAGGEQATPVISVDSTNGLITATAGTKSSTHQLAFQPAKTITPSTTSQIAVSSGYYTGGDVTVAAVSTQSETVTPTSSVQNVTPDSGKFLSKVTVNAIPSQYIVPSGTLTISANGTHDVKNYVSAVVNVEGGGGSGEAAEWSENEDAMVSGTISNYTNDRVKTICPYAFYSYSSLTTANFSAATTIGHTAFAHCYYLTTANFPAATTIGADAFYRCSRLTTANFPAAKTIGETAFSNCSSLTTANFPAATTIGNRAFYSCSRLTTANFPAATTISSSAFSNCSRLTTTNFSAATTIGAGAFRDCSSLTTLSFPAAHIGADAFMGCRILSSITIDALYLATLSASNAFNSTPYKGYSTYYSGTPYIYVPKALLDEYKMATNWVYFSSYFSAMQTSDIIFEIMDDQALATIDGSWNETTVSGATWKYFINNNTTTWLNYFIDEVSGCVCVEYYPYALARDEAGTDFVASYDIIEDGATYYIRDCTGVALPPF